MDDSTTRGIPSVGVSVGLNLPKTTRYVHGNSTSMFQLLFYPYKVPFSNIFFYT